MQKSFSLVAAVGLATVCLVGCRENFGTIPVEGRVTFGGAAPPGPGYLFFVPEAAGPAAADGSGPRSGSARWNKDGSFRAGTFRAADGLRPGTYAVRVECAAPETGPQPRSEGVEPEERSAVPAGAKPPPLVVPADSSVTVRYDVMLP